ncbi:MAG: lysophospholipid acyltransferase family protein [Acidobacteriota bacterium]|jgi:KDO2-lipid IV(A) lauroyltransferase
MSVAAAVTRAAAAIAPRLSFPVASGLGRGLGSLAWALDRRHREVALANLALAFPGVSQSQCQRLALDSFRQAGRNATEMLWSPALDKTGLAQVATFEGREHLDGALAAGNGVLLTTGHFGNWELMGVAMALIGVPMNVIARRVDDEGVEQLLYRLRTRTGARVIYKDDAVRSALRVLRDNQVVGVLIDQNTISPQASFVPFFGRLAATTRISAQLHVRTGAPIVMLFCVPRDEGYRFVFEPLDIEEGVAAADDAVERLTAAATAQIERHIRSCPEAWLWIHDRWRSRPPEEQRAGEA